MLEFLCGKASERKLRLFACACSRRGGHLWANQRLIQEVEMAERYADTVAGRERDGAWSSARNAARNGLTFIVANAFRIAVADVASDCEWRPEWRHHLDVLQSLLYVEDGNAIASGDLVVWERVTNHLRGMAAIVANASRIAVADVASDCEWRPEWRDHWAVLQSLLDFEVGHRITSYDLAVLKRVINHLRGMAATGPVTAKLPKVAPTTVQAAEEKAQAVALRDIFGPLPFRRVAVNSIWLQANNGSVLKLAQAIYDEYRFEDLRILAEALEKTGCDNAEILAHCRGPGAHVRGCWVVDLLLGKE
jgi:hypothetical protein